MKCGRSVGPVRKECRFTPRVKSITQMLLKMTDRRTPLLASNFKSRNCHGCSSKASIRQIHVNSVMNTSREDAPTRRSCYRETGTYHNHLGINWPVNEGAETSRSGAKDDGWLPSSLGKLPTYTLTYVGAATRSYIRFRIFSFLIPVHL
jgi:hypothetical protein